MDFEFLQKTIPVQASILTDSPFLQPVYVPFSSDIDERLHLFLKTFDSTARLQDLLREFRYREERKFTPLVFTHQVSDLSDAIRYFENSLEQDYLRRDEIEYIYIRIGEVFKSMAHISPKLKYIRKDFTENRASLISLRTSLKELIGINNILASRFEILDDSHKKLETKKLRGLLYKTNYFLEYKHVQVEVMMKK